LEVGELKKFGAEVSAKSAGHPPRTRLLNF
jgi:hypothetical protein